MRKAIAIGAGVLAGSAIVIAVPVGWFVLQVLRPGMEAGRLYDRATGLYAVLDERPGNRREVPTFGKALRVARELAPEVSDLKRAVVSARDPELSKMQGLSHSMIFQRMLARVVLRHAELLHREHLTIDSYGLEGKAIHAVLAHQATTDPRLTSMWRDAHSPEPAHSLADEIAALLDLSTDRNEFEAASVHVRSVTIERMDERTIDVIELTPILISIGKSLAKEKGE